MIEAYGEASGALYEAMSLLNRTLQNEPNPLHPQPGEVEDYVARLQAAGIVLGSTLRESHRSLAADEIGLAESKQAVVDALIRRQLLLAGRRMTADREGSIATLSGIFRKALPLERTMVGRLRGDFLGPCVVGPREAITRVASRVWMPWLGKRFLAATSTGENIFTPDVQFAGRLFWPLWAGYRKYENGLVTAFEFRTYRGPGVEDPDTTALKLDYDNTANPTLVVRSVMDELVPLTANLFLGKAFLRNREGDYRLAAFFSLRGWTESE